MRAGRSLWCAPVAAACLLPGACAIPSPPVHGGSDLDPAVVARVRATARTKHDLFRALGPPAAIFSRDRREPVPGVPSWNRGIPAAHFGTVADPAPAFEMFAGLSPARPDDRVYYWFHSRSTKLGVVGPFCLGEWASTSIDGLWALVDARTGAVRSIVFVPAP